MSSPINQALRLKEESEKRFATEEAIFIEDAISKLSDCLLSGGDLHETIEEISADYWDAFNCELENADINTMVILAASSDKRGA